MTEKTKNETASVTENDLHRKVREAINATDNCKYYYISRLYPYDFKAIAYDDWERESEDDFIEFKYTVNSDDTISITSQKKIKMIFSPKETIEAQLSEKDTKISKLNTKVSGLETQLSTKTDALVKVGEDMKIKEAQIAELQPYKKQIEQSEKEKKQTEIAEKKNNLKALALKGGYIEECELEKPEIAELIEKLDERGIKSLIADKVIAQLDKNSEKIKTNVEVSEKEKINNVKVNLSGVDDDENINSSDIMGKFLS